LLSIELVDISFHARKSARSREYVYYFTNNEIPVFFNNYIAKIDFEIDLSKFTCILKTIIGEHDFTAFKKSGSNELSSIRTIYQADAEKIEYKLLTESNKTIILNKIVIIGNSFLYQMIRNIIGSILMILSKRNKLNENDFHNFLLLKKRTFNFKPAPAAGLYLNKITY
jgi:tRNA pseudouridine38-40 synthase